MTHYAERVTTGGLAGQGIINLLGRPHLAKVALVVREAAQNSWDARKRGGADASPTVQFSVGVRTLSSGEQAAFGEFFREDPTIASGLPDPLAALLATGMPIRVLEISDEGTVGLSGATLPNEPLPEGGSRFVDFMFDLGKSHAESGDGGTYGFGRASLYLAGDHHTILVDSLTTSAKGEERRLMGCRVGHSFDVKAGDGRGRYSGRHFWGDMHHGIIQPLTGDKAVRMASSLGLPPRRPGQTGTTVFIPWAGAEWNDPGYVIDNLLLHLWPKLVPVAGTVPMRFRVWKDGVESPVPYPGDDPDYRPYVRALEVARTRESSKGAKVMRILNPRIDTGHLAIFTTGRRTVPIRTTPSTDDNEPYAERVLPPSDSVALMRPSELVVRYLPVKGADTAEEGWAAAFLVSNEEQVRTAFARAEPPAHDDWVPDRLSASLAKTIVKKTVKDRIPDAVRDFLGIGVRLPTSGESDGPSLARASARFSTAFLSGPGQLPGVPSPSSDRNGGGTGGSRNAIRAGTPRLFGVTVKDGIRVATFAIPVSGPIGNSVTVTANPQIHAQATLDSPPAGVRPPSVESWNDATTSNSAYRFSLSTSPQEITVGIALWGDYAISLDCVATE